ncbi:MAG: arginine ABC transporter substrate-binding protein [Enterobacteriaceae bacterium]
MKRKVVVLLLAGMVLNAAAAEKIRFASSPTNPPFESLDENNQFVGFDIDVAQALCKEMQAECTFHKQPFDSLITALKFRRYDAVIAGMDITAERSKQVAFSDPYYSNEAILIARKGKYSEVNALNGKRVGMENGTTHQRYLQARYPQINVIAYDSYQNALIDLLNGRLDAVFGDTALVNVWLKEHNTLATVGKAVTDPAYFGNGLGIAVNANNLALRDKFNSALAKIKTNGTYQQIFDKWFAE